MLQERRRRSLVAPLAKFAVTEITSIWNQSSLQSADDRVLELVQSLVTPNHLPVDSMAMDTKSIPAVRSEYFAHFLSSAFFTAEPTETLDS